MLLRTIPSTTIRALLLSPVIVAPPRNVISGSLPGCPVLLTTRRPVTEPCKDCPALLKAAFLSTELSSFEIAVVKVARFCEPPYPVITTSSNTSVSSFSTTL